MTLGWPHWGLTLEAPAGETSEFSIENKDGVTVAWSKAEVYAGDSLYDTLYASNDPDLVNSLQSITYGIDNYKSDRNVTIKVYVDSETDSVCEFKTVIQPRNINNLSVQAIVNEKVYNGTVQNPEVNLGEDVWVWVPGTVWWKPGHIEKKFKKLTDEVVIQYANVTEAKNVGTYNYKIVGVESAGYTGTIDGKTFEIKPATPTAENLSVNVSGTTTYGTDIKSLVTIKDKYTGDVIPSYLYNVNVKSGKDVPGSYTASTALH